MTKQNVYKRLRDLEKEVKNIKERLHREEQNEQESEQENDEIEDLIEEETNNNICDLYVKEAELSSITQQIHSFTLLLVPTLLAWGISVVGLYLKH
jgi:hypothetical protein